MTTTSMIITALLTGSGPQEALDLSVDTSTCEPTNVKVSEMLSQHDANSLPIIAPNGVGYVKFTSDDGSQTLIAISNGLGCEVPSRTWDAQHKLSGER